MSARRRLTLSVQHQQRCRCIRPRVLCVLVTFLWCLASPRVLSPLPLPSPLSPSRSLLRVSRCAAPLSGLAPGLPPCTALGGTLAPLRHKSWCRRLFSIQVAFLYDHFWSSGLLAPQVPGLAGSSASALRLARLALSLLGACPQAHWARLPLLAGFKKWRVFYAIFIARGCAGVLRRLPCCWRSLLRAFCVDADTSRSTGANRPM